MAMAGRPAPLTWRMAVVQPYRTPAAEQRLGRRTRATGAPAGPGRTPSRPREQQSGRTIRHRMAAPRQRPPTEALLRRRHSGSNSARRPPVRSAGWRAAPARGQRVARWRRMPIVQRRFGRWSRCRRPGCRRTVMAKRWRGCRISPRGLACPVRPPTERLAVYWSLRRRRLPPVPAPAFPDRPPPAAAAMSWHRRPKPALDLTRPLERRAAPGRTYRQS